MAHRRGGATTIACRCAVLSLLLLLAPQGAHVAADDDDIDKGAVRSWLFDISRDATERADVSTANAAVLSAAEELLDRYLDDVVAPYTPDTEAIRAAYLARGGVGVWNPEGPDTTSLDVPRRYNDGMRRSDDWRAPHVIVMLVDDWGYNDWGECRTFPFSCLPPPWARCRDRCKKTTSWQGDARHRGCAGRRRRSTTSRARASHSRATTARASARPRERA